MTTRAEVHAAVDRMFDRIEADGREALGAALAVPHYGSRDGIEHTTFETETETLHRERCVTLLAGAVHALGVMVDDLADKTMFDPQTGARLP